MVVTQLVCMVCVCMIVQDGISVAPSVLQHQVKKLFYNLSSLVTESLVKYEPSQLDPPTDTTNKDISHSETFKIFIYTF